MSLVLGTESSPPSNGENDRWDDSLPRDKANQIFLDIDSEDRQGAAQSCESLDVRVDCVGSYPKETIHKDPNEPSEFVVLSSQSGHLACF